MSTQIQQAVSEVKLAKAERMFWDNVEIYGSERHALRALDCINREEAIRMLAVVQKVSIFKINGRVVVQ